MSNLLLLSLPQSAAPSGGDPQTQLSNWIINTLQLEPRNVNEFSIPSFKIGTLDNLVTQSEELAKVDTQFSSIVSKLNEIIEAIYGKADKKLEAVKKVDGKSAAHYFETFKWNTSKYRVDKWIHELVDAISKEAFELDQDVRDCYSRYNNAKSNLKQVDSKQTGNLAQRSLHDVVKRENFVQQSEYLTTVLVAVPKTDKKKFVNTYETMAKMVVPRSAGVVDEDSDYTLYNVTLFKKFESEFTQKCREQKWVPREFKYSEELISDLRKEQEQASETEQKLYGEITRLTKAAYSDIIESWAHIKALRTFVESVLRYGLPPNFLIVTIDAPSNTKAEKELTDKFGYLGGQAFQKDSKGKLKGDTDLHEFGTLVDTEYKPFVLFEMEF